MKYEYCQPDPRLHAYVGSYYIMHMPEGGGDVVRAEIPHIRIILSGSSVLSHGDRTLEFSAPDVVVCGPAMRAGSVAVSADTLILGISLLPRGWASLFGVAAAEVMNAKWRADDLRRICPDRVQDRLLSAPSDQEMFRVLDDILLSLVREPRALDQTFLSQFEQWSLDPHSPGIDELKEMTGLSVRTLDRLCKLYLGASPKRLHRKYRALQSVNRIARTGTTDWRVAAGEGYYDQAHFIKDFRDLIGCTPGTLMTDKSMMIRFDLMKRLAVPHHSGYSIIG